MSEFDYTALGDGGEVRKGLLSADNREAAIAEIRGRGLVPLRVSPRRGGGGLALPALRVFGPRRVQEKDLMLFTRELRILLAAGLPIDRALAKLETILSTGPMREVPVRLLAALRSGASLGAALSQQGEVFPAFYVGMVKAGEAGGFLVEVLARLGRMLERSVALKAKIGAALAYPLLVLALTGLSLVVLLVFVVPEFRPMLEESGVELPLMTRAVFAVSGLVTEHGQLLLAGLLALLLAIRGLGLSEGGRARLDRWTLGLPMIGSLVRTIETARFCRSLGTLRANGVALVEAVGIAAGTLTNRAVQEAARRIAEPLARGEGLARPLRATGLFPDLALQLIEVGEESGRLEEMLLQVAEVYDEEVERRIQQALALLAPLVTVFLGILVALIIGSILGAILSSYEIQV